MIQILVKSCEFLVQLVIQILKGCFSYFLSEPVDKGMHGVQLSEHGRGASENLTGFQQLTRSRPCRITGQIVDNLAPSRFAGGLRIQENVIDGSLGTDHIRNEFMAHGSPMLAENSSEFEYTEDPYTHIESTPSDTFDSSIKCEILSWKISNFLQSVKKKLENMDISGEPSGMVSDSKNNPTSAWVGKHFLVNADSVGQILVRKPEPSAIFAKSGDSAVGSSGHLLLTTEKSERLLENAETIDGKPTPQNVPKSLLIAATSIETTVQNGGEFFQIADDSIDSAQESGTGSFQDFKENSEQTLDVTKSIPTESSAATLIGSTSTNDETDERSLQSYSELFPEIVKNIKSTLDSAAELLITESSEATSERSSVPSVPDIEPKPHSSSSITFKSVNNTDPFMPQQVAADLGMEQTTRDWDVNWTHDFVSFRTCRKMKRHQRINHFPGSICLSNKDLLGGNLNVMYECFPREYDIFPKTWFVPGDMAKIERYARQNKGQSFIVKPHDGGSGSGIRITRSVREISSYGKVVCQLYIQRPFLIDGYKFDFRVYVLLTSIEPLRIFVHNEGLARFATAKYEKPSVENSSKKCMHLTNTCVNRNNPSYIRDESNGSTRRITSVFQWFTDHSIDAGKIQESMDDTIIKTIIVSLPTLKHYYHISFPHQTTATSCFELMGFDIMLDHKLKVYLLEVNVAPSFGNETRTSHVACIKQEVVSDTFRILNLMETERNLFVADRSICKGGNTGLQKGYKKRRMSDKVKDKMIANRRIEWENSHVGNFRKIYPPGALRGRCYQKFIEKAFCRLKPNQYLHTCGKELTVEQRKWLT